MATGIGKGCECIYDFEKHYITLAIKELIDEEEKAIRELKEKEQKGKLPKLLSGLKNIHEIYVRDLKVVRERLEATPTCK